MEIHELIDGDDEFPGVATTSEARLARIAELTSELLEAIGEDVEREGLERTPLRVAKAWEFLTSGYRADLHDVTNGALFAAESSQMVIVKNIDFSSLCEHHLLPFFGRVHIGYLPERKILGLSKFARVTDLFARRLQVQERMTGQIATALASLLEPQGVGVVVEATHQCMAMRGVQKHAATTVTSSMLGAFRDDQRVRSEFLAAVALGHDR